MNFDPKAGTEQAGPRPALVLSPLRFNVAVGLFVVCPITNQMKGGPFEVPIPAGCKVTGVVLSEHMKSADWLARGAKFVSKAPPQVMEEVLARVQAILFE